MAQKKANPSLSGFGVRSSVVEQQPVAGIDETTETNRTRGKGDKVAIAVRLNREDWIKLHDFANRQGLSMQQVIVFSLAHYMQVKGIPPISGRR